MPRYSVGIYSSSLNTIISYNLRKHIAASQENNIYEDMHHSTLTTVQTVVKFTVNVSVCVCVCVHCLHNNSLSLIPFPQDWSRSSFCQHDLVADTVQTPNSSARLSYGCFMLRLEMGNSFFGSHKVFLYRRVHFFKLIATTMRCS